MGRMRNEEIVAPGGLKVFSDEGTTIVAKLGASDGVVIADSAGNELIKGPSTLTSSAINEITITNSAANTAVSIVTTGGGTNPGLTLSGKGTGAVTLGQASGSIAIVDGVSISAGATTGTSFGTNTSQKISLYGVTPAVQPTIAAAVTNAAAISTGAGAFGFTEAQANAIVTLLNDLRGDGITVGVWKA